MPPMKRMPVRRLFESSDDDSFNSTSEASAKRQRTSNNKSNTAVEAIDLQATAKRSMLLNLKRKLNYGAPTHVASIFVPQHILQRISVYERQIHGALATKDRNQVPTITDEVLLGVIEQPAAPIKAIDFLDGAPLPNIGEAGADDNITLSSLLGVYDVCIELQIKTLEEAILGHMSSCTYATWDTFIKFAKEVYGDTGKKKRAVDSSVGKVVKLKLTAFLPRLMQDGTAQRISAMSGVLSAQLLEITIKHFSGDVKLEQSMKIER